MIRNNLFKYQCALITFDKLLLHRKQQLLLYCFCIELNFLENKMLMQNCV